MSCPAVTAVSLTCQQPDEVAAADGHRDGTDGELGPQQALGQQVADGEQRGTGRHRRRQRDRRARASRLAICGAASEMNAIGLHNEVTTA